MSETTSAATGYVTGSSACVRPGSARARRSTRGGPASRSGRRARRQRGGVRSPGCRTRSFWRRSTRISSARRSGARAIGRSTRGCGSWTGIRVARTRLLRVMREHGLLSPHRGRQGNAKVHDGTIVTQAPNVMWGTDGVRVFTRDDGWVWIFAAVEHWNAECVGWHVCKVGEPLCGARADLAGARAHLWLN